MAFILLFAFMCFDLSLNNHLMTLSLYDNFRSILGKEWHRFVKWVRQMALKSASREVFKSPYIFIFTLQYHVTRTPIHQYATAAQVIFMQVYKRQLLQYRTPRVLVIKTCSITAVQKKSNLFELKNTHYVGANDTLTHLALVPHICVSELGQHWCR